MIIAGKNDCVTRPEIHQVPIYSNLKSLSKIIITIKGGSHCQMADRSTICRLGESTCKPDPEISDKDSTCNCCKISFALAEFPFER